MERRMIVVKNLPNCSQDTIENYLEVVCDSDVEEIQFYVDRIKHIAMVTMEKDLADVESLIKKARKRTLEGNTMELVEVAPSGGVLVSNLPSNITEDTLRFYFENPKSGGEDDGVKCCRYYENLGLAKVVFRDPDVARRVLAKTDHTPAKSKPKVTVKPYYAEFHEVVLDFLTNLDPCDNSEEDNSSTPDSQIKVNVQTLEKQQQDFLSLDSGEPPNVGFKASSFQNYEMVSLNLPKNSTQMMSVCGQPAGNVWTEGPIGGNDSWWQSEFQRPTVIPEPPEPQLCFESKQTSARPNVPPKPKLTTMNMQEPMNENIGKATMKLPSANVRGLEASRKVDKEFPKCELTYDSNSGKIMVTGPQSMLHRVQLRLYQDIVEMSNPTHPGPQIMPQLEPDVKERTVKDTVKLCTASVRLLESSGKVNMEFPKCQLTYNAGSGSVTIEGQEMKIQELKLRLYEENHEISCASHQVPETIADIMKTEKGKTFMDKELKGNGNSVWYLDGNNVQCVSFSEPETNSMVGRVKRLIQQEHVSYNNSHYHYLKTPGWTELTRTLEKDQMVKIVSERDKHKIRIDGLDQDVDVSKRQIEKELKGHSHKAGTYTLSGARAKCIKGCFAQDLADVKKIISNGGGQWDDTGSMNSLNLKFDGDPNAVKKAESALKHLEKKVWHERLLLGKDVAKEKDLNLLIEGLHRSNLRAVQAAFEDEYSVFLDLKLHNVKKQDIASAASRDGSTMHQSRYEQRLLQRSRSLENVNSDSDEKYENMWHHPTCLPAARHYSPPRKPSVMFGNITILVKKGDISKEKVDVLVNVVTKNYDLSGTAVSRAFAKAGGEEFKQQFQLSNQMGAALVETPGAIIQTKSCGKLPSKMVYTIALDKWTQPDSKTEFKILIDSCLKTADGSGYSSLGLTSVGCGRLFHFPAKFVASCLVNVVKDNSKLPNLKHVNIVLNDPSMHHTFLTEINPGQHQSFRPTLKHSRTTADFDGFDQSGTVTVGSTDITVQQGDITKSKATVLVNVVTTDLDIRSTTVSRALLRAGGEALLRDFEDKKDSPATNNIIVTSGGKLNCKYIYHLILKKWNLTTEKEYQTIVHDCFKLAGAHNTQSIVFPPLGCGALLKYPPSFVASCLLDEAKLSSVSDVTVVIFNQQLLVDSFMQELRSLESDDDDNSSENLDTLRKYAKSFHADRVPSSDNKTANIVIYGPNEHMCNTAKDALSKQLKTDYLHTEIIKNENLTHLTGKTFASLKDIANKNGICIKFPDPDRKKKKNIPELKLKGEKTSVVFVKSHVQEILMKIRKPLQSARGTRGSRQFLQDMALMADFPSPSYWTHFKPKHPLREILQSVIAKITGAKTPIYELVTVDKATFKAIDSLVQKTWDPLHVGHGKDALGLGHKSLKVKAIERLEHPDMFKTYCQERARIFSDASVNGVPFDSIDKLPGSKSAALTTMYASAELQRDMYPEVNEHYFFHGTKIDYLDAILSQGLDARVCNKSMLGGGVYGAESSTKADQYTDDKNQRTVGEKKMVLMRMTLGLPYVCNTHKSYCRPPCKDLNHLDDKCTEDHGFFHSVLADGKWLFREFVVYDGHLCYIEYIITYDRV